VVLKFAIGQSVSYLFVYAALTGRLCAVGFLYHGVAIGLRYAATAWRVGFVIFFLYSPINLIHYFTS